MMEFIAHRDNGPFVEVIQTSSSGAVRSRGPLPACLHLAAHSPTGFEWGFHGSGPAQLALAMLTECFSAKVALRLYMRFRDDIVSQLPHDGWRLTEDEILNWLGSLAATKETEGEAG